MAYFYISSGFRGAYMPDNIFVARFRTRRELRKYVEYESADMIEAHGYGYSKRDRAAVVATIWREVAGKNKKSNYNHVIGFGRNRDKNDRPFGLFISHATRHDFLEYQKENN